MFEAMKWCAVPEMLITTGVESVQCRILLESFYEIDYTVSGFWINLF